MRMLIEEKKLKPPHLLVLIILSTYGKNGQNIYPSVSRIAHDTNYSEAQIKRILKELEELKNDDGQKIEPVVLEKAKKQIRSSITYNINYESLPSKKSYIGKRRGGKKAVKQLKETKTEVSTDEFKDETDKECDGFNEFC